MSRQNIPGRNGINRKRLKSVIWITIWLTLLSALSLLLKKGLPYNWTSGMVERFWAHVGSNSMYLSFFAIGLLVVKICTKKLKSFHTQRFTFITPILKFFSKYHIAVGWAGLVLAAAHSVYYLILLSPKVIDTYTGILAIIGMAVVTWIGIALQNRSNHKKTRWWHMVVGIAFIAALLLHDYYAGIHHDMGVYEQYYGK